MLAELDAELRLLPIGDERMWGRVDVREGRISMDLSSFLPAPLREQMVRVMLGQVLRVPLPDLPEPYRLTAL
ncbi:hypothetical protein ACFY0F_07060 [Streptomyces sp. NPDC001544]|uniref:hypothetical protein n=1 Tax=Streptomyces sp. NPDC001544 TaxID=3364584 RepID=UPI0036C70FC7